MSLVSTVTGWEIRFIESTAPPAEGAISARVSAASYNATSIDMTLTPVGQSAATLVFHDVAQADFNFVKAQGGF